MKNQLMVYGSSVLGTAILFCVLDFIWLGMVSVGFYKSKLGPLMLASPRLDYALAFYIMYIAGMMFFCVLPALRTGSLSQAFWYGIAFGLVAYGTYDLTNMATLRGWSAAVVFVDLAWGAIATALASSGGLFFGRLVLQKIS